jgi:hypothetical protein
MPGGTEDPNSTTVELPVDTAAGLHQALGGQGTLADQPGSSTVSVSLDADTAAKLKDALGKGLTGAAAFAYGEDNPP